jgi:uncharacterized alpha/beta hydrolase family protein
MKLEKGKTYYMLTYADPDKTMPDIEPLVFLGKNTFTKCL